MAGATSLSRSCQHLGGGAPRNPGPHGSPRRGLSLAPGRRLQVPELHLEGRVKGRKKKGVDPWTPAKSGGAACCPVPGAKGESDSEVAGDSL